MPTPTRATTLPRYTDAMARGMSEATLQTNIVAAAKALGWHTYHTHDSRRSDPGFPDLCLVHSKQDRCLFAELKRQNGRSRPDQLIWADNLKALSYVEYHLWRPSDWLAGDVTRILAARPA